MMKLAVNINNFLRLVLRRQLHSFNSKKPGKIPIIVCKRPEFNHFKGQTYSKLDGIPLASNGWMHQKSRGDYFVIYGGQPNTSDIYYGNSFENLGLNTNILEVLNKQGFMKTTEIQEKSIPLILMGSNTLITAETGCGKTLAYLIPLLQYILKWKNYEKNTKPNHPLAVIITPLRELASQIGDVAKKLFDPFDLTVTTVVGGNTKRQLLNPQYDYTDVLVISLGALSKLVTTGIYNTRNVHHVILDEADTLLDDTFIDKLSYVMKKFKIQTKIDPSATDLERVGCQLIMASATMPRELPDQINSFVSPESIQVISTSKLHRMLLHVPQKFIRLGKAQKPLELLKQVQSDINMNRQVMIFSNKSATCDWASMFLNENNIECVNINGQMAVPLKEGLFEKYRRGDVKVLSCTDIASRGLDTTMTKHVINYDFPLYTADYIHRCGRTGRIGSGSDCRVTNFIAWPREIELVQRIETAVRLDKELPSVNANIRRMIQNRAMNQINKEIRSLANT